MLLIGRMKKSVESYWAYLQVDDPYNAAILEGNLEPEMLSHFLVNVHILVQHTPIHLRRASAACEKRGLTDLKIYFDQKFKEEQGHDQWAEADMIKLQKQKNTLPPTQRLDPTMSQLILHIEKLIDKDPYLYLPYIFFAEYLCVLYGPKMTKALEDNCGYLPRSMTVIENHAELDKDHVDDWEDTIRDIVDEKTYEGPFLSVLAETIRIHKLFFLSCAQRRLYAAS